MMMDSVSNDIVKNNTKPIYLAYSGGMDSTAVLLALLKQTPNVILVHMEHAHHGTSYSLLLDLIIEHMSKRYSIPVINLEYSRDFYPSFVNGNIKRFVFCDGMDIAYTQIYENVKIDKLFSFSYGEGFRAFHPFLDVLLNIIGRMKSYFASRGESGGSRLTSDSYLNLRNNVRKNYDVDVIDFDSHSLFIEYFNEYYSGIIDVFSRKRFTYRYITDAYGKKYNSIVKEIYLANRSKFKPFISRVFDVIKLKGIKMKPMRNTLIKPWQKTLWLIYCIVYRTLFGLNHPGDCVSNHSPYVSIGEGCAISGTAQFIPQNHKLENPQEFQEPKPIKIGNHCWLGTNVVILPGVTLGDYTTVGANAVVTRSFPQGNCVLVGVPAKKIRDLVIDLKNEYVFGVKQ